MSMKQHKRTSRERGLTVVEMIVVLVITSLLLTVVLGAFAVIVRSQSSIGRAGTDLIGLIAERERVRDIISQLFPSYDDDTFQISGSRTRLVGKTRAPLFGWHGRPTPFELRITQSSGSDGFQLEYEEPPYPPSILMDIGPEGAEFAFSNERLQWLDAWPPRTTSTRSTLSQPTLVRLVWGPNPEDVLIVYTANISNLPIRPSDLPGGS